jgi:ComF family protein
LCSFCGEKLFALHAEAELIPVCGICRRAEPRYRRAVAYGAYAGSLRDLLHVFKYQQVRSAGPELARMLGDAVDKLSLAQPLLVVAVPLWPGKRRARGFNQSEELARAFVRTRRAATSIQLDTTSLVRTRETASQTGLTRLQRRANLRGAFAVTKPERVRDRSILLIDDVLTTGSTAGECARVLLRAGAHEVFVATVARATRDIESAFSREGSTGHA